jgi:DnaK suppressor protein
MKASMLKEIRKDLERRRREILAGAQESINGDLQQETENLPDPTDLATNESDQSFNIRIRERERKLLTKIEQAIGRIDEGGYGICEVCGGEIGAARLKARPVTTLCIQCKTDQEEKERRETL